MSPTPICSVLVAAGLLIVGTIGTAAGDVNFTPQTCVRAPHDRLCPHFPDDQTAFDPQPIEFPQGRLGAQATPASVLLKTAWRVVQAGETGHLTASGLIHVPADRSDTGAPLCLSLNLGMVGMHIVTRVASGNGEEWIWSTFEHRDNVPVAGSARRVNSLFTLELFPEGCTHPPDASGRDWSFYNPALVDLPTNTPNGTDWSWASHPPHARIGGEGATPPQIVRCWDLLEGTRTVNAIWQARLGDSVLHNYMLISSQWRGANKSPLFPHGELPRFLTNTTVETFVQIDTDGTCLGYHTAARTATGAYANFTFLLREAE